MLFENKKIIETIPISIATTNGSVPNIAIAADVKVVSENQILISHNEMIKTIHNIKENHHICITVFDNTWQGIRMHGTAKYFSDGKWKELAIELFANENTEPKGAILVTITKIENQS